MKRMIDCLYIGHMYIETSYKRITALLYLILSDLRIVQFALSHRLKWEIFATVASSIYANCNNRINTETTKFHIINCISGYYRGVFVWSLLGGTPTHWYSTPSPDFINSKVRWIMTAKRLAITGLYKNRGLFCPPLLPCVWHFYYLYSWLFIKLFNTRNFPFLSFVSLNHQVDIVLVKLWTIIFLNPLTGSSVVSLPYS